MLFFYNRNVLSIVPNNNSNKKIPVAIPPAHRIGRFKYAHKPSAKTASSLHPWFYDKQYIHALVPHSIISGVFEGGSKYPKIYIGSSMYFGREEKKLFNTNVYIRPDPFKWGLKKYATVAIQVQFTNGKLRAVIFIIL